MRATVPPETRDETTHAGDERARDHRTTFLVLAAARGVLSVVAVLVAPVLYRDHANVLVLLRPTKEVFLFAGFLVRAGDASLPAVVIAALPMLLVGVWIFYGLGRAYADELDDDLPGIAGRLLPRQRIEHLRDVLDERGMKVVFLGRLAAFPSTLMAAAAGSAGVPLKQFLLADGAGAVVSLAALLAVGYALGETYDEAGPFVTAAGVAVLAVIVVVVGRALTRSSSAMS